MNPPPAKSPVWRQSLLLTAGAAAFFNAAYSTKYSFLIFGYVICLVGLARLPNMRFAFYAGFVAGFLCFAPQLGFFWGIFGRAAIVLWAIMAFWIALFVALACAAFKRHGATGAVLLAPFLWTGLEYFRSELYYLRFSWLNVGYALAGDFPFGFPGVYGVGFLAVFVAGCIVARRWKLLAAAAAIGVVLAPFLFPAYSGLMIPPRRVQVAGVQMEFPSAQEAVANLDKVVALHPDTELLVLSEYTFEEPVPQEILDWCRGNKKYLIIGGIDPVPGGKYYDTAFVVGPDGNVVFKQAKSVPIQFFNDGLPAQEQKVWDSPWGGIGICICYDLSYERVTDALVRSGARAIIVPAMDVKNWGKHEHELNARVALVRAAEYNMPIFRIASSGISQLVNAGGVETATAPFGEDGAIISGQMEIFSGGRIPGNTNPGRMPIDRYLAPLAVAVTAMFILWLPFAGLWTRLWQTRKPGQPLEL